MKCRHCKSKLSKDMKYCPVCGAKVSTQSGKRMLFALLVVALLAAAAGGTRLALKENDSPLTAEQSAEKNTSAKESTGTTAAPENAAETTEKRPELVASGSCGETVTWTLTEDGTLTISGDGAMDDYDGDSNVPWSNADVKVQKVVFDGAVTKIGAFAFYGTEVEEITIPYSVSEIGFFAIHPIGKIWVDKGNHYYSSDEYGVLFDKNKSTLIAAPMNLSGVYTVPESVTRIEHGAFTCCIMVTEVNLPETVREMGTMVFYGCFQLTSLRVPSNVHAIESYAFSYCTSLTDLSLPSDVSFAENAFEYCVPENIYYEGTKGQWESLQGRYASGNEALLDADVHYESY